MAAANSYHLMSLAIEGRFIVDHLGKERFRELMEAHAAIAGIEIYTWAKSNKRSKVIVLKVAQM